jgi:hypothetical protein
MLVVGAAFWEAVQAVHVAGSVLAFWPMFVYPFIDAVAAHRDPRAMPWFHRMQSTVGQRLVAPSMFVVAAAGIYLAFDLHQWHAFYVWWGLGVVILIGALGGVYFGPTDRRLAELAERDIAAATPAAAVSFGPEYRALRRQIDAVGVFVAVLVLTTIYLMTVQTGA